MRTRLGSLGCLVLGLGSLVMLAGAAPACAQTDSVVIVNGDGGAAGDAATSSCTAKSATDSALLCGGAAGATLFTCAEGAAPPSGSCTKGTQASSYCCTSSPTASDGGTDSSSSTDLNPYGIPYPTDHIGLKPRAGSTRGDRVENLGFQGYKPSSSTLRKVTLADLYDPDGKTHDVVFLVGGTLWSVPDQGTYDAITASSKRVAMLAVLGEGTSPGQPATLSNLANFRAQYTTATTALDAGFAVLGAYFDSSAVPFVMVIDARTMEIASAGVGGLTSVSQVDAAVTAVTSRAPAY